MGKNGRIRFTLLSGLSISYNHRDCCSFRNLYELCVVQYTVVEKLQEKGVFHKSNVRKKTTVDGVGRSERGLLGPETLGVRLELPVIRHRCRWIRCPASWPQDSVSLRTTGTRNQPYIMPRQGRAPARHDRSVGAMNEGQGLPGAKPTAHARSTAGVYTGLGKSVKTYFQFGKAKLNT